MEFPVKSLKSWFLANRRALPWRVDPTPYRVWVSEVMLQQTQVVTVIPYFERWMRAFPSIRALAEAPLERVLKLWEGLGYYSRARHLHGAALYLLEHFEGQLPEDPKQLDLIKGLGPYTQGAIRSFAFKQKAAAVDGNVMRVLSRYYAIKEDIDQSRTRRAMWECAEALLPDKEPWLVSEGLIELGATVCTKQQPACGECPLKESCLAFRHALQASLPHRRPRQKITSLRRLVGVIYHEGKYLVKKGEQGKVMADLYEFPYLEIESEPIEDLFGKALNLSLRYKQALVEQQHTFTRFRVQLIPHLLVAAGSGGHSLWKGIDELDQLPFSSGHRRILRQLR